MATTLFTSNAPPILATKVTIIASRPAGSQLEGCDILCYIFSSVWAMRLRTSNLFDASLAVHMITATGKVQSILPYTWRIGRFFCDSLFYLGGINRND